MPDAVVAKVQLTEGRGNAGPVESMENQRRVSHAFHRPLEISQESARFPHSHRPAHGHGKVENQKQVSHFPTAARDDDSCSLSENQKPKKGSRPLRGLLIPFIRSPYGRTEPISCSSFDWKMLAGDFRAAGSASNPFQVR
jgi:hypothetical protein